MQFKILFIVLSLVISFNSIANTQKHSEDTIPFIIYKLKPTNSSQQDFMAYQPSFKSVGAIQEVEELPLTEVSTFIRKTRATICSSAGNADVKVWFSVDMSGKILGIGMAGQSGLEVTFHCKNYSH